MGLSDFLPNRFFVVRNYYNRQRRCQNLSNPSVPTTSEPRSFLIQNFSGVPYEMLVGVAPL